MTPSVLYHCTCTSATTSGSTSSTAIAPPPPHLESSNYAFHPLHTLFFCEECDAVRCNRCVAIEVSGYYCPNCLFEVPSASVRAEKNRCARNCFQCPHCSNTLSVVPSDPAPNPNSRLPPIISAVGEPPFFLYCNYCRWDSADSGITFDKPTGLAQQLQKTEDSSPDTIEFERLKEHFEPLIRSSTHPNSAASSSVAHHHFHNPITAAASSALNREVPGLRRSGRNQGGRAEAKSKEDWGNYKARIEAASVGGAAADGEIEWFRELQDLGEVATLEQRWVGSWAQSLKTSELRPLRIPLHSKQSKRCPKCRHILIKPEQKSQSVRYKIKLMAANYLPSIEISLISSQASASASSAVAASVRPKGKQGLPGSADIAAGSPSAILHPGKTYSFQLALTNPLYEPIQVRLTTYRGPPSTKSSDPKAKPPKPPFAVSLPSSAFPISAFAEAWEYDEDDDEMFDDEELEDMIAGRSGERERDKEKSKSGVCVLERKANVTKVGGEVVVSKDGVGDVKFNMLVSYTYRADEAAAGDDTTGSASAKAPPSTATAGGATGETKTFSFFTVVSLGTIVPDITRP